MCWTTSRKEPIKRIALLNIPVFKILKQYKKSLIHSDCQSNKESLLSLCYNFKYEEGETYSLDKELECVKDGIVSIFEGFHSYSNYCKVLIGNVPGYDSNEARKVAMVTSEGNNILSTISMYSGDVKWVKMNCIIPKGSEYYLNEYGEYVSDKIKICNKNKILE